MIENERLAVLQSAIKASSMNKPTRRLVRAALRAHLDEMHAAMRASMSISEGIQEVGEDGEAEEGHEEGTGSL